MEEKEIVEEIKRKKHLRKILSGLSTSASESRSQYAISKKLGIDYGEAQKNLRRLEEMGLIECKREESKKGVLQFRKTWKLREKGRKILEKILKEELQEEELHEIVRVYESVGLSEDIMKELEKELKRLREKEKK